MIVEARSKNGSVGFMVSERGRAGPLSTALLSPNSRTANRFLMERDGSRRRPPVACQRCEPFETSRTIGSVISALPPALDFGKQLADPLPRRHAEPRCIAPAQRE